jgi:hypothetical protein
MSPADRDRIEELLQDPSLSCRAISRATGYSDWTVRKIARDLDGDPRPMKRRRSHAAREPAEDASPLTAWLVFGGVLVGIVFAIWLGAKWIPPSEL